MHLSDVTATRLDWFGGCVWNVRWENAFLHLQVHVRARATAEAGSSLTGTLPATEVLPL